MGKVATSPLPPRGSPPLQSGGQNQKWPIHGQGGYITPAASGIPTASKRGGGGGKIRSGPYMGKVATSPLTPRGSPRLQSGGQNQKWPINGQGGYITPAASEIPTASKQGGGGGQNQKWPINGQGGYITPAASGIPTASKRGAKSEVAHKWARWLHHPCRLGDPHRFKAGGGGGGIRSGPYMGKVATSPLPPRGSPPLHSGGAKSELAHTWTKCLHHPCRLGDPHGFRAGGKIRSGP